MECPSISQIARPQMEPISQLAPYLNGLNIGEAVEGFNQLADMLLTSPQPTTAATHSPAPSDDHQTSYYFSSWPASSCSSSSASPVHSSSSSSASHSVSSSSGPASVASSSGDDASCFSNAVAGNTGAGRRRHKSRGGERRKKNATAAERYRLRLKGRDCGLVEELEREEERNAKLVGQLESKLSLYREFVSLLAQNTTPQDVDLAQLGATSVSAVLSSSRAAPVHVSSHDGGDDELRTQLDRFQHILVSAQAPALQQPSQLVTCHLSPVRSTTNYHR